MINPLLLIFMPLAATAISEDALSNKISGSESVYNDIIEINYLKKVKLVPEKDWIGTRVYNQNGTCFEIKKELKNKVVKEPFGDLYNSAMLPESLNLGVIETQTTIVNCENYITKEITIQ